MIKSLIANEIVVAKQYNEQKIVLNAEGVRWLKEGTPEIQILAALSEPMDKVSQAFLRIFLDCMFVRISFSSVLHLLGRRPTSD